MVDVGVPLASLGDTAGAGFSQRPPSSWWEEWAWWTSLKQAEPGVSGLLRCALSVTVFTPVSAPERAPGSSTLAPYALSTRAPDPPTGPASVDGPDESLAAELEQLAGTEAAQGHLALAASTCCGRPMFRRLVRAANAGCRPRPCTECWPRKPRAKPARSGGGGRAIATP